MSAEPAATSAASRPIPRETRARDHLPTREVLDWVKSEAWRRASLKAFGLGWPVGEAGLAVMRLAPLAIGHAALVALCPQVARWRLAVCIGVDPNEAQELANRALSLGPWVGDQAREIFELLRGEGER